MAREVVTVTELYEGAILASVAHAIAMVRFPDLSNEHSWDGKNYSFQDSEGSRGTVTFDGSRVVGACFLSTSPRNPFKANAPPYSPESFLSKMPNELADLARKEACQYVLDGIHGQTIPILTTAFWSSDGILVAGGDWADEFNNGLRLLRNELRGNTQAAQAAWAEYYDFNVEELALVIKLTSLRLETVQTVVISQDDRAAILKTSGSSDGETACRESFAELDMTF